MNKVYLLTQKQHTKCKNIESDNSSATPAGVKIPRSNNLQVMSTTGCHFECGLHVNLPLS